MKRKDPKRDRGRVVRVTFENNRIFKQMLLDLYDMGIFRTPNQLADELFEKGLHEKRKELAEFDKPKKQ